MSNANAILTQIAVLQASLAKAKVQERANYRANVRPALLSGFKTLLNANMTPRAAALAIKAMEPAIAATIASKTAPDSVVPNYATVSRRNTDRMPKARRDAIVVNRQYFVGTEWNILETDRLYPTLEVNPKKVTGDGYKRFNILQTQPGITFAEFKRQLGEFQKAGHLWAGNHTKLKGEVSYNLNDGLLRLERD